MNKEFRVQIEKENRFSHVVALSIALICFSLVGGTLFVFLMGILLLVMAFSSHLYLNHAYKPITVETKWSQTSVFPAKGALLSIKLANESRFGIYKINWEFQVIKKVAIEGLEQEEGTLKYTYSGECSLGPLEALDYQLEVLGIERGAARIENFRIILKDPLGLGKVTKEFYLKGKQLLIYPELKPIQGLDLVETAPMGEQLATFFSHEDPTYKQGARLYQSGDPFQRIDWKASARKQELHTKILDKTAHTQYVFIGNVRTSEEKWKGINEKIAERTISILASLSQHAFSHNIPNEMIVNMRNIGKKTSQRINQGEGRKHFIHTLETLAKINIFNTHPFEEAVYLAYKEYTKGKVFVLVTPTLSKTVLALSMRMRKEGIPLYIIRTDQEQPIIQPMNQGMIHYA